VHKPHDPVGQFRDTFIIAVDDEGLAIIDQHVAHERVLFERVMERLTSGRFESQRLLVPMVLELAPSACQALINRRAELERFGFELEGFGGATIKVTAVPALLKIEDCSKALLALAEDLEGSDRGAAGAGCAAAHRGDHGVPRRGQGQLPADLREDGAHPRRVARDRLFNVCPHGRPVIAAADAPEIEKNFDRIYVVCELQRSIAAGSRSSSVCGCCCRSFHGRPAGTESPAVRRRHPRFCCRMGCYALDSLAAACYSVHSLRPIQQLNTRSSLSKRKGHPAFRGSAKLQAPARRCSCRTWSSEMIARRVVFSSVPRRHRLLLLCPRRHSLASD
jgi:hypothetical protein